MILIVVLNVLAAGVVTLLPNEFLVWNAYAFFAFQLVTMMPFLLARAVYLKNVFLPTFFALLYLLINLTIGGYLTPRGYGFYKDYAPTLLNIDTYRVIVPYLMLTNVVLFGLTYSAFRKLAASDTGVLWLLWERAEEGAAWTEAVKLPLFFLAFVVVSNLDLVTVFPLQLGLMIVHLTDPSLRRMRLRYGVYAFYLLALVAFTFENKREIVMALFLTIFVEAYYSRARLSFSIRSVAVYLSAILVFFGLVMTASIMRGYGGFRVATVLDAVTYVPQYVTSDIFIDAITDNLELNYNYGATVNSIDLALTGRIDYQFGATIAKVLFLPVPRELFPAKPQSIMQIYTQAYAPNLWLEEGSLPVVLPSEMFLNFHLLGLVAYAGIWALVNSFFTAFHSVRPRSFRFYSCAFLTVLVLALARGSGLELYVLYYLLSMPIFAVASAMHRYVRFAPAVSVSGVAR